MSQLRSSPIAPPRSLLILAGAGALLVAAAVALWVRYGSGVFYEMVAAGVAWCF